MESIVFGSTKTGQQVKLYTLFNDTGMKMKVMDFGAAVVSLFVPDRDGVQKDIVLGYDTVGDYEKNTCYFGAVIGRNANRIRDAKCSIGGVEYLLEDNDHGNNLHSGTGGFHAVVWEAVYEPDVNDRITFLYESPDNDQGFPGKMSAKVSYCLTKENRLAITYEATADKETIANFTNHTYFNLNGHASGSIEGQKLLLHASGYTPVEDEKAIPTGEIAGVQKTPMDFRTMKEIGKDMEADFAQLRFAGGYDHNYALDKKAGEFCLAARAESEKTGITMEVYTDCPGIQFYSGNFITPQAGKGQAEYDFRHGFCLETQYFPNAVNQEGFEPPLLAPGETYRSRTEYAFGVI